MAEGIEFVAHKRLDLNFGHGNDQYRLYAYPGPAEDETMGIFFEWHTEDFFNVDSGPHLGIGMRGPVADAPHRGRGLAIGILASHMYDPQNPQHRVQLFSGCPGPPGGPSFFIEDFSRNDGLAPIKHWQLSRGKKLPLLRGHHTYRIDIHVSTNCVWAGVWQVTGNEDHVGTGKPHYTFMDQLICSQNAPGYSGNPDAPCPQVALDQGRGNAFIGTAFADPETSSWVDNVFIAHWKES